MIRPETQGETISRMMLFSGSVLFAGVPYICSLLTFSPWFVIWGFILPQVFAVPFAKKLYPWEQDILPEPLPPIPPCQGYALKKALKILESRHA